MANLTSLVELDSQDPKIELEIVLRYVEIRMIVETPTSRVGNGYEVTRINDHCIYQVLVLAVIIACRELVYFETKMCIHMYVCSF